MKKTLGLLFLLLLLLVGWYFLDKSKDEDLGIDVSDRRFAVENLDDIGRIVIASRRQEPTILQKENGKWYVGQEKKLARKNAMDNLLKVVKGLKMMFIPTKQSTKNILNEISLIGVKVQIYDTNDKLIKGYTIGGSPQNEIGTFMLMDGHYQPYTMHLPSLEGSVRGRFEMKNIDWRDRAVFRYETDDIDSLIVEYPKNKSESFTLTKSTFGYDVKPTDKYVNTSNHKIDSDRARAYWEGYDELYSEYIENGNSKRDSVKMRIPFGTFTVVTDEDRVVYDIYPLDDFIYEEEITDVHSDIQSTRYFIETSNDDFYLVQQRLMKKLLRGYSYFLKE